MKPGEFIIDGVSSLEFKTLIQERPSIPSAKRKLTVKQIPGVSGDYLFDEEAYDNVSFSLSLFTTGNSEEEVNQNRYELVHLFNGGSYIEMQMYSDKEFVYEVSLQESIEFEPSGRTPLLLPMKMTLSAKPFKRISDNKIWTGKSLNIHNPYYYASKPEITLYGNGDMQLVLNETEFPFKEIDEHVVIDSEVQHAYKQTETSVLNRNNKMYTVDFPVLEPGDNILMLKGNATKMRVNPRWVVKI